MKIKSYLIDNEFKIIYTKNVVDIINYEKINYLENTKISLNTKDNIVAVSGKNLKINKLLDNELLISGNIISINIKDNK